MIRQVSNGRKTTHDAHLPVQTNLARQWLICNFIRPEATTFVVENDLGSSMSGIEVAVRENRSP